MNEIIKIMDEIQNKIQLSMEYETDARDIWPKRWELLREEISEFEGVIKP